MIGKTLSYYRILAKLGSGGMGEVYKALDTKLGREVAIKVLPEIFSKDNERLARFEREARLLASLNHPNIATLHGFEQHDGIRFFVLELVPGNTLAELLAQPEMSGYALTSLEPTRRPDGRLSPGLPGPRAAGLGRPGR